MKIYSNKDVIVTPVSVLFEALDNDNREELDRIFKDFRSYASPKQIEELEGLLSAIKNKDISNIRKYERIDFRPMKPADAGLIEYLQERFYSVIVEEVRKLPEKERIIYNLKNAYFNDLSTVDLQIYYMVRNEYPRLTTINKILSIADKDLKRKVEEDLKQKEGYETSVSTRESVRIFRGEYNKVAYNTFVYKETGTLTSMFPEYHSRIASRVVELFETLKKDKQLIYDITSGETEDLESLVEGTAKDFYLGKITSDAYRLAIDELIQDPSVLEDFDWDKAVNEYKRIKKIYDDKIDELLEKYKSVEVIKKIIEEESDINIPSSYSVLGNDQLTYKTVDMLSSGYKQKKSLNDYLQRGVLKIDRGTYQKDRQDDEINTKNVSFINTNKDGSFNFSLIDPTPDEEVNYIVDSVNRMVGGWGLPVFLAFVTLANKRKSRYIENVSIRSLLADVMGYESKAINTRMIEQVGETVKLFDQGSFRFTILEKGKTEIQEIKPITFWKKTYDIDNNGDTSERNKPVDINNFKNERLTSVSIELNPELYKAMQSNKFLLFDERILKTDRSSYPLAIPLYFYAYQRFRLPNQIQDDCIKASVKSIFKRLGYSTDLTEQSDQHIPRNYEAVKKTFMYLVEDNLLGSRTKLISEDDEGTKEDLLNRIWLLYPTDKGLKQFKGIKNISDSYKNKAEEKSSFTRDEVKKIWEDSHLTLGEFAKQTGIGKDVLSKYLNGKTTNLSPKIIKKLNLYLQNKEND